MKLIIDISEKTYNKIRLYGLSSLSQTYRLDLEKALKEAKELKIEAETKIIHCGECAFAEVLNIMDVQDGYRCRFHPGSIWFSGSFCSWAKAKAKAEVRK